MRKTILVSVLSFVFFINGYSQCKTCYGGRDSAYKSNKKLGKALPPDSSGGLALSYLQQNVCGLNWEQSSVKVTTRYPTPPGTGLPATVPLTFDSCGVDSVIKAYLYFNGSPIHATPNPATVSITNPVAAVTTYSAYLIGTAGPKCWLDSETVAYRTDVTSCIYGGGNYTVNIIGNNLDDYSIDGITLVLIYKDKSATYSGSIALWDGVYTTSAGGSHAQTLRGINVCNKTPTGQAFCILADMQDNVQLTNTEDYNGSVGTFPNSFYNFCTVTTSLTAGQTSTYDSVYTDNGGDCYSWVLAGLYWQNSNCMTCHPSVLGSIPISVVPPIDTICQGDSVQLTASGASTYIWNPPTGLSCNNCPNPKASPNATTTYTVTGFNGCIFGNDTVEIVVSPKAVPTITPANPAICYPGSVQLNVTGGANYVWKPSATLSCDSCSNPIASPSVTTTYTVVSGYKGCKDSATVTVVVTTTPTITTVPQSPKICKGGSVRLTASGASGYRWTPAASLNCPSCSNPLATPTVTTVYTVVGSNGQCSDTITDTVFVVPGPVPVINPKSDSVCQGDSVTLNGSGGGTYHWSNGKTTTTIRVAPAATTTYTLSVSNGICTDSTTAIVKITPKITALTGITDSIICPNQPTHLSMNVNGGQATYKWNDGETSSSITVSPTVTTTYTVTAYGLCDSVRKIITVTVIPLPKPVISGTLSKCKGQRDTLTVTSSINPTTYLWSDGNTTTTIITGNINADSTFYVTAFNSLGCPVTDTFHVNQIPYATATITYPPGCGANITTITASASGSGNITYQWSTGGTHDTIDVLITGPTTYSVIISNNGCPITKTINVIQDVPPLSACCDAHIFVGGDTVINASGGTIVKYKWLPDSSLNCDTCATVIATPTVTTTYTVIGTDAEGCTSERTVTILVELPCFNLAIPNVFTPDNGGLMGLDKVFYIKTENINSWSLNIYDRWGKEMYSSTNPNEYWGGTTKGGGEAPAGVYYYIISGTCQNTTYKKDGFVQLIR